MMFLKGVYAIAVTALVAAAAGTIDQLTTGKRTITVKFQPRPQAATGSLFELRAVQ
jgi:hypothetical protein